MAGSGVAHFLFPAPYSKAIPEFLPFPRQLVYLSGAAELVAASLLAVPRTRKWGGWWTLGLLLAIFPANLKMAIDGPDHSGRFFFDSRTLLLLRLPLQAALCWWAYSFTKSHNGNEPRSPR